MPEDLRNKSSGKQRKNKKSCNVKLCEKTHPLNAPGSVARFLRNHQFYLINDNERHAEQAHKRLQMEQTLSALRLFAAGPASPPRTSHPQPLRVGEAAKQVGVRVSAVHFWEQQGLLHPTREQYSHYRLYDEHQMYRLRVVALLRDAGYPFSCHPVGARRIGGGPA